MIAGTRGSRLAMAQTDIFVKMMAAYSITPEIRTIRTAGDTDQITDLKDMGGYGAFVRELDNSLLAGEIDVSVNSMKDVPVLGGPEITIGAVLKRASCEDAVIPMPIDELPQGAVVGSSSVRRTAILRSMRPDLDIKGLRGNIDTRLEKLDAGGFDAVILAKAGLERLGIERGSYVLDPNIFVPAPGQGAIAVACRSSDRDTAELLKKVDDAGTRLETETERSIMRVMGGICSSPIGINAKKVGNGLRINAVSFDGAEIRRYSSLLPADHTVSDLRNIAAALGGGHDGR